MERAQARVENALAEYEAAKAELAWWRQGLELVDPKAATAIDAQQDFAAKVVELFPDEAVFSSGARPTLRQAIAIVMRDSPFRVWPIGELTVELKRRHWLPDAPDAQKRVSDLATVMFNAGQLARVDRGVYKLSPPVEAILDGRGGQE